MIIIVRDAFRWTYLEKIKENSQLREKYMKIIFENAILQYFSRWIQWNTLKNSIPNIFRRILKIRHFRPHFGTLNPVAGHQASRYSSGTFFFEFLMLQSIRNHVDIFNRDQFWQILKRKTNFLSTIPVTPPVLPLRGSPTPDPRGECFAPFLMILDASWQLFLMSRKIDFYENSEPGKMSRRWRLRP